MARPPLLINTDVEIHGASTLLVVILHGLGRIGRSLHDLHQSVCEELPDADIFIPQYSSHLLSNVNPRRIADQVAYYIDEADTQRSQRPDRGTYERIILIGFSAGGLMIRKTYLIAMGYGDDEQLLHTVNPHPWAKKVDRIILMAALNRGISDKKPEHLNRGIYLLERIGWALIPPFGVGKLLCQIRQGSPFVANLRVQWIRLSQAPDIQLPTTIQLLGDVDEVVAEEDNIDVLADAGFRYLKVRDTGHGSICHFRGSKVGAHRRAKFCYAMTTPISQLRSDGISNADEIGQSKDHVVFIMHGIRDMGRWTSRIREAVDAVAQQQGLSVESIVAGYGYFPMLRFLFLNARQTNVRWFMDRYTEAIARYPNAKISFIGHSNGTYLLASALSQYHACRIHHVAFAGSVVPKNYPWDQLIRQGQVKAIRNDVASGDWVVGVFPGFFELLNLSDIGTAGHNGFQDDAPKDYSFDEYFQGDHGAAIQPQNHRSLAHFILTGEKIFPDSGVLVKQQSGFVVMLAKLCWLVWLLISTILVSLGILLTGVLYSFGVSQWIAGLIYLAFVLLLLYTI